MMLKVRIWQANRKIAKSIQISFLRALIIEGGEAGPILVNERLSDSARRWTQRRLPDPSATQIVRVNPQPENAVSRIQCDRQEIVAISR
jgi:hypothetical protein